LGVFNACGVAEMACGLPELLIVRKS